MKFRNDHLGLYGFDRTGLNVLLDEVQVPRTEWAVGPRHLSIALTNACELACSFCYAPKSPHVLRFDDVVRWCKEGDSAGALAVGFGGGEPTLFPRFPDLCAVVRAETGLGVTMTTHGHRFTPELSARLSGSVDFIRVSMDGLGSHYQQSRGRTFASFEHNLKFIAATAPFGINVVVSEELIPELPSILDFAQSRGARQLLLLPRCSADGCIMLPEPSLSQLREWIGDNLDWFPLASSSHGAREMGLPVLPVTGSDDGSYEHLHIDAQAVIRLTAFSQWGVSIREAGLIQAIRNLREREHDEKLVWIRN